MNNVTKKAKICNNCSNLFLPKSNNQKKCEICSFYLCKYCNKTFQSRKENKTRIVKFCSLSCTNEWQRTVEAQNKARKTAFKNHPNGKIYTCITCKTKFYVPKWKLTRANKYCRWLCRNYKQDAFNGHFDKVLEGVAKTKATKLEIQGNHLLKSLPISPQYQVIIGKKFVVDVLIPEHSLVIQWDGDFWHGNPSKFITLNKIQAANQARDKRCDAYLTKCGYKILRFWESDVYSNPEYVKDRVKRALESSLNT